MGVRVLSAAFSSMIIPPKERGRPAAVFSYLFLLTTSGGSGDVKHKVGPIASINQQITTRVMRTRVVSLGGGVVWETYVVACPFVRVDGKVIV